jgi:uncharacterized protein VirK/YbjX
MCVATTNELGSMVTTVGVVLRESRRPMERQHRLGRMVAALRVTFFPGLVRELRDADFMSECLRHTPARDTFFFLTHKYYLAKTLTLRQRTAAALFHSEHETRTLDEEYRRLVYHQDGMTLWSRQIDENQFEIRLATSEDNRHEGDLSVRLEVNGTLVCRMSYSIVDGSLFGVTGPVIFVTRNQTSPGRCRDIFRDTFRQNAPPYFCLAAIVGAALGLGMESLAVIRSETQIAFEPQYVTGFKNSYCHFWAHFDARDAGEHGYLLEVPPYVAPLSTVKRGHRARAQTRRRYWNEITAAVQATFEEHRLLPPA